MTYLQLTLVFKVPANSAQQYLDLTDFLLTRGYCWGTASMLQSPTATNPQQIVPYHKLGSLQPFVDWTPHFVSFAASEGSNGNDTQGRKKKKLLYFQHCSCITRSLMVALFTSQYQVYPRSDSTGNKIMPLQIASQDHLLLLHSQLCINSVHCINVQLLLPVKQYYFHTWKSHQHNWDAFTGCTLAGTAFQWVASRLNARQDLSH